MARLFGAITSGALVAVAFLLHGTPEFLPLIVAGVAVLLFVAAVLASRVGKLGRRSGEK